MHTPVSRNRYRLSAVSPLICALLIILPSTGGVRAEIELSPGTSSVIIPPGHPIEIAVAEWEDWGEAGTVVDAISMAIEDYGPVKGFDVQTNHFNAGCDMGAGTAAAMDIVANAQHVGVLGPMCSSSTASAAPILETAGLVMISPASTMPGLITQGPSVFNRVVVPDPDFEDWDAKIAWLPSVLSWQDDFEGRFGYHPGQFGKYAYDAALVLLTHVDGVSTVDGMGNLIVNRVILAGAVRLTAGLPGVTDLITIDPNGDRVPYFGDPGPRFVAPAGSDDNANPCLDPNLPCASVQRAVALAEEGEQVLVAQGHYVENLAIPRSTAILGGFETVAWSRNIRLNPTIIDGSGRPTLPGDWDGMAVAKPAVIRDGTLFRMWYDGQNLLGNVRVGLASSANGRDWVKSASNPVLAGTPGSWDELGAERAPFILKEGGLFKMWYEGGEAGARQLGYATSPDGIHWTKYPGNPVLANGPEPYDQEVAGHGTVLHEGIYKLWYHAIGSEGIIIAYATSPDGIHWIKQGPVLTPQGGWDECLWGPSVLRYGGLYWMWYAGACGPHGPSIGVATSPDGINWTRPVPDPVITADTRLGDPQVILHGSLFKMWYQDFDQGVIKYAESVDGIHWSTFPDEPVLWPGEAGRWGGPTVKILESDGETILDGLIITGGHDADAGGVRVDNASARIVRTSIEDNFAHGMPDHFGGGGVGGSGELVIVDSTISGNRVNGGAGGVRFGDGNLIMINALVADNQGDAGIHVNGSLGLMNVTVTHNDGGIIFNPPGPAAMAMANSIVYGNGWAIGLGDHGTTTIAYSDIEGGWAGLGNIDEDPRFVNPASGNYHLRTWSPCIDAGINVGAPDHDLEGDPRPLDGNWDHLNVTDMGVDEYSRPVVFLPTLLRKAPSP